MTVSRQIVGEKRFVGRLVAAPVARQSQQENVEPLDRQRNPIMDEQGRQRPEKADEHHAA